MYATIAIMPDGRRVEIRGRTASELGDVADRMGARAWYGLFGELLIRMDGGTPWVEVSA